MFMIQAVLVITRARLLIARNTFWRGKLGAKIGLVAVVALVGLGAFGLYSFVRFLTGFLTSADFTAAMAELAAEAPELPTDLRPYLLAVPSTVLLGALLLLVLSSFGSLLSSLYLSGDMDLLLVAPVPMRAVFVVKFFDGLLGQYMILAALLGPVLIGFGQGMGYGPLYLICAALVLLLLPLLPAGLGALLMMGVVRVVPARRAREIIGLIGGLIGISFYVVSQLGREIAPAVARPESLAAILASNFPLLPSAWAGRALLAAGEGDMLTLLVFGGLFLVSSLAVFSGCLLLAERLYYAGWSNMATQGGRQRRGPQAAVDGQAAPAPLQPLSRLLPPQSLAIFQKDLRLFFRDLRNLQQLIFPIALAGIWTFNLLTNPLPESASAELPDWATRMSDLASGGIALFICVSVSNAIAGPSIGREGKAYWQLKLAPVSPLNLLLGKFALAYLPYPTIGTLLVLLLALLSGGGPAAIVEQWLLLLLVGLGSTAISLGLGASFPRLSWENPQQQVGWQAGCLSAILFPLYVLLTLGLVVGAGLLGGFADSLFPGASVVLSLAGWLLAVAFTALACWLALLAGSRGVEKIEV